MLDSSKMWDNIKCKATENENNATSTPDGWNYFKFIKNDSTSFLLYNPNLFFFNLTVLYPE